MRRLVFNLAAFLVICASIPAFATVFANVHGVVHDPAHRPIAGADVTLLASDSAFTLTAKTNAEGEFALRQTPLGVYTLKVSATGFATAEQPLTVASDTNPVVHIPLAVASATQTVVVSSTDSSLSAADTVTPTTLVSRVDI